MKCYKLCMMMQGARLFFVGDSNIVGIIDLFTIYDRILSFWSLTNGIYALHFFMYIMQI